MNITRTAAEGNDLILHVEATPEEVDRAFTDGLDVFVAQFGLESLEGETSLDKIKKALEPDAAKDAVSGAVINYLIPFVLEQEKIIPMATSDVNAEEDPTQGSPFTFDIRVMPKPEFELDSYDHVSVVVESVPAIKESDIDMQVYMLAEQFATIRIDENGEEIKTVPEVTDEWVKENLTDMGMETAEELRQSFRETSERVKEEQMDQRKMNAVMAEYEKRFHGEITEEMVHAMTDDMFEQFKAQLAQQEMTLMDFMMQQKTDEMQIRDTFAVQAKTQLKQGFILDAIFRHHNLKLGVADLMAVFHNMAPGNEEKAMENMEKSGRMFLVKEAAQRMMAASYLMDRSEIKVEGEEPTAE